MHAKVSQTGYLNALRVVFLTLFFALHLYSSGQDDHPYIKHLSARVTGERLLVSWTTKAGFSCQDIGVEFSRDSIEFTEKAVYYGICGDVSEKDYRLIIDSPFYNVPNYIRLNLGTYGYSYVIKAQIFKAENVLIFPHPVKEAGVIYFSNPNRAEATLSIYDLQGRFISENTGNTDAFTLNAGDLPPAVIYRISLDGTIRYQGTILLSH